MAQLNEETLRKLKHYLTNTVTQEMELRPLSGDYRQDALRRLEEAYAHTKIHMDDKLRDRIFREVLDNLVGYGPIQPLLDDPTISEIMVNGPGMIYIEREGELIETDLKFEDEAHVMRVIDRIVYPIGRRVDRDHPTVDARLPDGSRVNIVIPPSAIDGPCITIRKFLQTRMTMDDLVRIGSLNENMVEFLKACVVARLNIVISGPTSSGKTTFLNILSGLIPGHQRIVTIEDAVELQLKQRHVVRLETQNANQDGIGEVTTRDMVRNA